VRIELRDVAEVFRDDVRRCIDPKPPQHSVQGGFLYKIPQHDIGVQIVEFFEEAVRLFVCERVIRIVDNLSDDPLDVIVQPLHG